MIGCSEFCGYYDWTFEWLRRNYGEKAVAKYWREAIGEDSQTHARDLIVPNGIAGMAEYWAHTLEEEEAGYTCVYDEDAGYYRIDMFACPSKGYNIAHGYEYYHDYCDHCMGWIDPLIREAGFVIHHDHNHLGQCWMEIRRETDDPGPSAPGELTDKDMRLREGYGEGEHHTWVASEKVGER